MLLGFQTFLMLKLIMLLEGCLITLNSGLNVQQSRKHFQFFNHLMLSEGFNDCVLNAWSHHIHGNPFFVFSEKLKRTKRAMISLNSTVGNLSSSVKLAKDDLHQVQSLLHLNPQDSNRMEQEQRSIQHLWAAMDREEILFSTEIKSHMVISGRQKL